MSIQKAASALKTCTKCKSEKNFSEFSINKQGKNGLQPSCKQCINAATKAWAEKNKDRKNASSLAWDIANPEKIKVAKQKYASTESGRATINQTNSEYRAKNPEKIRAWAAAHEARHPEAKESRSAYKKAHLDNGRAYQNNRRARQLLAPGSHTPAEIKNMLILQRSKCACCKLDISGGYHVDHVMPLSKNGGNGIDNIQLLCPSCNVQKQAMDPIKFMQSRGYLL